jgi:hypothetical protein
MAVLAGGLAGAGRLVLFVLGQELVEQSDEHGGTFRRFSPPFQVLALAVPLHPLIAGQDPGAVTPRAQLFQPVRKRSTIGKNLPHTAPWF